MWIKNCKIEQKSTPTNNIKLKRMGCTNHTSHRGRKRLPISPCKFFSTNFQCLLLTMNLCIFSGDSPRGHFVTFCHKKCDKMTFFTFFFTYFNDVITTKYCNILWVLTFHNRIIVINRPYCQLYMAPVCTCKA